MANKLDDRYVEYDLANSINVLPVEHGGTGSGSYPHANRIMITQATGIPASPIKIAESGWDVVSLGALASWNSSKGAFEARVQSIETHRDTLSIHVPSGGTSSTFLRGDGTWQLLSSDASSVYTVDNFSISNANNVQGVLEDIDAGLRIILQPGLILPFAFQTAPNGFLLCDGAEISRTTYSNLFNYIGVNFGSGNGSTTFNVPDLRGQFIRGWDAGAGVDGGRAFGSNQDDELKSHNHTTATALNPNPPDNAQWYNWSNINIDGHWTNQSEYTGGSETRPKNVALLYCIKY